jgi:formamidopyrimidine-DNA glycosylase
MPELPEVETVARRLRPELRSRAFVGVQVLWERTIDRPDVVAFRAALIGARVVDVARRGKYVTVRLDTGPTLLVHLRMTGKLLIQEAPLILDQDPHLRVCFELDDGRWLLFSDTRKFGRMYLMDDPLEVLGDLGPEPLSAGWSHEQLADMLAGRRGRIKPLLLNQRFLAGLGNIYTDEALWRAGVHPLQTAGALTPDQVARLHGSIVSVLQEAIRDGGTSLRDNQYRQPDGRAGAHQSALAVYGRAGRACPRCTTPIERIVVGQRGTYFCPACQVRRHT